MNYYPNYSSSFDFYRSNKMLSYIRLLHASPDAPAVDVYANNNLIAKNLSYKNFTEYLPVPSGNYNIKVFPVNTKIKPVINSNINIPANTISTVVAGGLLPNINLYVIPEPPGSISKGKTFVRFAHLSPNAPKVDIVLPDGSKLFKDVGFKEFTKYLSVKPGKYIIDVRPSGTSKTVLHIPNVILKPDRYYTIYAVGLVGGKPPLEALLPLDGVSYLKF